MAFTRRVPMVVVADADQIVNNSTTLVNDDDFVLSVEAGKIYAIGANAMVTGSAGVGGFKWALSGTATITSMRVQARILSETSGASQTGAQWTALDTSLGTVIAAASNYQATLVGTLEINAAGTLKIQWAQNTANASDTTRKKGSSFWLMEI